MASWFDDNRTPTTSNMIGLGSPLPNRTGERRNEDDRQASASAILSTQLAGWSMYY